MHLFFSCRDLSVLIRSTMFLVLNENSLLLKDMPMMLLTGIRRVIWEVCRIHTHAWNPLDPISPSGTTSDWGRSWLNRNCTQWVNPWRRTTNTVCTRPSSRPRQATPSLLTASRSKINPLTISPRLSNWRTMWSNRVVKLPFQDAIDRRTSSLEVLADLLSSKI